MKTLVERVEYFQKLWSMLFPATQVENRQIINWLMSFSDSELELVMSKASRRARMEPGTDLHDTSRARWRIGAMMQRCNSRTQRRPRRPRSNKE